MNRAGRAAALVLALLGTRAAHAQSGIRFELFDVSWVQAERSQRRACFGLGFDHDLNSHLAFGVDAQFGALQIGKNEFRDSSGDQFAMNYRAYYLIGDHDGTSGYVGSYVGFRSSSFGATRTDHATSIPLGFRLGLRGSLPGSFGDIFLQAGAQLGGHLPNVTSGGGLSGFEVGVGIHVGFGWE